MRRLLVIAPFLVIGPLSGPLAFGIWSYGRAGRPAMAAICALGIADVYLGIPVFIAKLMSLWPHH
jgi:hypothetical protein